jgi:hypothetical protein
MSRSEISNISIPCILLHITFKQFLFVTAHLIASIKTTVLLSPKTLILALPSLSAEKSPAP